MLEVEHQRIEQQRQLIEIEKNRLEQQKQIEAEKLKQLKVETQNQAEKEKIRIAEIGTTLKRQIEAKQKNLENENQKMDDYKKSLEEIEIDQKWKIQNEQQRQNYANSKIMEQQAIIEVERHKLEMEKQMHLEQQNKRGTKLQTQPELGD